MRKVLTKKRKSPKFLRLCTNTKGISPVISSVILSVVIISVGMTVIYWAGFLASDLNSDYIESTQENLESIKESIVLEYVTYNTTQQTLTVYLLNSGQSNNLTLNRVYVSNASWAQLCTDVELRSLAGNPIPSLDRAGEAYITLTDLPLGVDTTYTLKIITERDGRFEFLFIS